MSDNLRRGLSWSLLAICLVLALVFLVLFFGKNGNPGDTDHIAEAVIYLLFLVFPLFGTLIVHFRPQNTEGLVFSLGGFVWLLTFAASEYGVYAIVVSPGALPAASYAAWLSSSLWMLQIGLLTTFALLLFPTGRLPGPRWRAVAWLAAVGMLAALAGSALMPGDLDEFTAAAVPNPLGLSGIQPLLVALVVLGLVAMGSAALASAASLFLRLRRSQGVERQQMKWFAFAASLAAGAVVITMLGYSVSSETGESVAVVTVIAFFGLPIAGGIAILRYRLYDIDILINRTLVYVSLTAILAGLYAAAIPLFRFLFEGLSGGSSEATIVLTTLVLAAVFTPVKSFLQSVVDRYFGRVPEPRKEMTTFAEQLRLVTQTFDAQQTLSRFLGHALRITSAAGGAIYLMSDPGGEPRIASGSLEGSEVARLPLMASGDEVGWLVLRGSDSASLSDDDRDLLQDAANVVAEAVALTARTKGVVANVPSVELAR
jgi:hypothetical protein